MFKSAAPIFRIEGTSVQRRNTVALVFLWGHGRADIDDIPKTKGDSFKSHQIPLSEAEIAIHTPACVTATTTELLHHWAL